MQLIEFSNSITYTNVQIQVIPIRGKKALYHFNSEFEHTYGKEFDTKVFCISVSPIPVDYYIGFAIDPRNVDSYFSEFNRADKQNNTLQFIIRVNDSIPDTFTIYYSAYKSKMDEFTSDELKRELQHRGFSVFEPNDEPLNNFSKEYIAEYLMGTHQVFTDDKNGAECALEFVEWYMTHDEIMPRIHLDDIEYDLKRRNIGMIEGRSLGPSLYRWECIELFQQLAKSEGFDFVYQLLEPHKKF